MNSNSYFLPNKSIVIKVLLFAINSNTSTGTLKAKLFKKFWEQEYQRA